MKNPEQTVLDFCKANGVNPGFGKMNVALGQSQYDLLAILAAVIEKLPIHSHPKAD